MAREEKSTINGSGLEDRLKMIIDNFQLKSSTRNREVSEIHIDAFSPWDLSISLNIGEMGIITIKNLKQGDFENLKEFGRQLSPLSKDLFCPYPWDETTNLDDALHAAINNSVNRTDAAYLIFDKNEPIGHFFLWKASHNPHSGKHGLEIPELGVAVADKYHSQGLGRLSVEILQAVVKNLQSDAIELTTAMGNEAGWNTYLKTGFEYVGIIRNPLGVDVTAVVAGEITADKYREERQMVFIINKPKKRQIIDYLELKRVESANA